MDYWTLQRAIVFLVENASAIDLSKPMILHSVRVGQLIESWNMSQDVVVAGYLHDVIEDTPACYDDIDQAFGVYVAELVDANSMTPEERSAEYGIEALYERISAAGEEAMALKAADIVDNWTHYRDYYGEEKWLSERESLERKKKAFLIQFREVQVKKFYTVIEGLT